MKSRVLSSEAEVEQLIHSITLSADAALDKLSRLDKRGGLAALWELKFSPFGCDPLRAETPLNLIEQLNQTFTYLATARAVKLLLRLHPELGPFAVNLGNVSGYDIASHDPAELTAEVFAAVNTRNNRKLAADLDKMAACQSTLRYVFFMCPGYPEARQERLERGGVRVWSLGTEV